jgi:hypothetical protein
VAKVLLALAGAGLGGLPVSAGAAPVGATTGRAAPVGATTGGSVPTTPDPSSSQNQLTAVSCPDPTTCIAVGWDLVAGTKVTLVESWGGSSWSVVPSPNQGSDTNTLAGVSCIAPTSCVAVGSYFSDSLFRFQTLVESWNGVVWSVVPSPDTGTGTNALSAVSCLAGLRCTAVGFSFDPTEQTLVESGSGSTWTAVPSPDQGTGANQLNAVSCPVVTSCQAVGWFQGSAAAQTLVESWGGSSWSVVPSPDQGTGSNQLNGVSCVSVGRCQAVGFALLSPSVVALVATWDGSAWSLVASPSPRGAPAVTNNQLNAVSCDGPTSCLASGFYYTGSAIQSLTEAWDGTGWSVIPNPVVSVDDVLESVSCTTAQCTSAGSSAGAGSSALTLVVTDPAPTPAHGYWLVGGDGGIFTFGSARFYGSTGALVLVRPVVAIAASASRDGYWLVAADGGIFSFGDARYHGSIPGLGIGPAASPGPGPSLTAPIVGMVPSVDGAGYFLVGADGGVFAFGDARYEGSCPGIGGCDGPAAAVVADATGRGYWLVTTTGSVYAFGDARYLGAPRATGSPVAAAARTPDGQGYLLLLANGTVDAFGDAPELGSLAAGQATSGDPATALVVTSDGEGYWVATADGAMVGLGDAPADGGESGQQLNAPIVAAAGF